jgi:hypothetical protein
MSFFNLMLILIISMDVLCLVYLGGYKLLAKFIYILNCLNWHLASQSSGISLKVLFVPLSRLGVMSFSSR